MRSSFGLISAARSRCTEVLAQAQARGGKRALVEAGTGRELTYAELAAAVRYRELVKYKGYQVAPAELEEILLTHPAVADCAVVRSPDAAAGEAPKAFVVLSAPATADEITTWVARRVAPYKRVRRVEFTGEIPRSPSGKILRRLLAGGERAAREGDLTGTVVLISGGGRGLGRLLARTLASAGINNAGVGGPLGPMWDADPADWWRRFEISLFGAYALTRIVLPDMIAAGHVPVLSVDPGLLPIGLTEPLLNGTQDPDSAGARVTAWTRDRIASGHGADPGQAARLILQLARGRGDRLSGRHLTVADDLDILLARLDQIQREDLLVLRLRTDGPPAGQARRPAAAAGRSPTPADSRGSAQVARPQTAPAYYLGRPAHVGSRPAARPARLRGLAPPAETPPPAGRGPRHLPAGTQRPLSRHRSCRLPGLAGLRRPHADVLHPA